MPVFVTKADGTKQLFERKKIMRTCLRMGASRKVAEKVAERIERSVYNGVETRKILKMVFRELGKHKPAVKYRICLRRAMSLMKPRPDFERFIQLLLSESGYEVTPNQIVRGRCVEHEIDAVARKSGVIYLVEVKHHYNYHTSTGLDEGRIARAVFEDVTEGFRFGLNRLKVSKSMIVVNTKFSDHARRYARCREIHLVGWSYPQNQSLQTMIEGKKLYPLTCLKSLNATAKERLASAGILLLKQLAEGNPEKLRIETKIPKDALESMIKKANVLVSEEG